MTIEEAKKALEQLKKKARPMKKFSAECILCLQMVQ